MSFSNYYWAELGNNGFSLEASSHHSEGDFARVRALGFNSVRFGFNGNWYQQDRQAFWAWLDRNIAWARAHDVLLTLDLHVPIGGDWLAGNGATRDFSIWTDEGVRQQTVDMWRAIAKRYRNEPAIAGYEILNEAVTEDDTGTQWRSLAQEIARAIREVDRNHLLIVGALYGTNKTYSALGPASQFLVRDSNTMYDFHFYVPVEFTHHNATWTASSLGDQRGYPDLGTPIPTGQQVLVWSSSIRSPRLQEKDTPWRKYQSEWVRLDNPDVVAGLPIATARSGARGSARFDRIEVLEFDVSTRRVSRIVNAPLTQESVWHWWPWSSDGDGASQVLSRSQTTGANDNASLRIDGNTTEDDYLGWSSDRHWFKATPGNHYKITGYMAGAGVVYQDETLGDAGYIGLELNFYTDPKDGGGVGFHFRDREFIEAEFLKMYQFGIDNDVPVSVMEFGTMRDTFEIDGKGGEVWMADVLDIFHEYGVSYSLWNYHGSAMGVYLSEFGDAPAEPNHKLIAVLRDKLRARPE
ncbi:cellulase family glycosylhydrolase [Aliisedimentitalea sp. MJ-SS2]|uniref:glycoside hydrolase family 5 protein n=1 Tax=Aliisedimentitalea sp. MJ-SS2 TaxID=3049795 RepID=UPI00292CDDB8|nr:cellulase family glycosylhydrolase [Alisedimentitalea sp. MJ-SS2]